MPGASHGCDLSIVGSFCQRTIYIHIYFTYIHCSCVCNLFIALQDALVNSNCTTPFCAFNGNLDVWVDVGDKRYGIEGMCPSPCVLVHVCECMNGFMCVYVCMGFFFEWKSGCRG